MAKKAPSNASVIEAYNVCDDDIKNYYSELISLLQDDRFSNEIAISYCFFKLEQALHRILYGGLVGVHRADKTLAMQAVDELHLTRNGFVELCSKIFKDDNDKTKNINQSILSIIKSAEKVRDRVMHGKDVKPAEIRKAITVVLMYSTKLNSEIKQIAGFTPFGSMKGFKGRSQSVNETTTKWLLKGLGF